MTTRRKPKAEAIPITGKPVRKPRARTVVVPENWAGGAVLMVERDPNAFTVSLKPRHREWVMRAAEGLGATPEAVIERAVLDAIQLRPQLGYERENGPGVAIPRAEFEAAYGRKG